ncbi:hypothetical protein BK138_32555 [Paenibacillus rhizosphaerae]|uniref:Uncharacterized protein n=1 Tax=Paenibacillus rhizosphaerae TaxID=297318 RepID=A0A1R1E5D9_9BACL|nr:hypothetical protein BK138_32555 [Paenibacillus rhizosphaerae]
MQWISISEQGAIPETPAPGYTWEQIHQLNEESYQQYKDVKYQYALRQFRKSYLDIINYINKLDEEELNNPKLHPFTNRQPIWVDI